MSSSADTTSSLDPADMAYIACATVGVLVITPGIALFYGTKKTYLSLLVQAYLVTCVIFIQWYLFGFSLASAPTAPSSVIGDFSLAALRGIGPGPLVEGGTIPTILSFVFSGFFPVCTVAIVISAVQRVRMIPSLVLGFVWATLVYCPQAYWTWGANGWLLKLGALDLAGGGPVHVSGGIAVLAYAHFVGKRIEWKDGEKAPPMVPYSPVLNFIGSLLIYFPWLFFNSGTPTTIQHSRTLYILANTQIAVSFAMPTFVGIDYYLRRKWSVLSCGEGIIVGLVFITPSCGYLEPWAVAVGSVVTAVLCRLCYGINDVLQIDDHVHGFAVHGIGGIMGSLCLGVFASPTVAGYDNITEIEGGWIFHHWKQMGYQIAGVASICAWTFVITYSLCFLIDKIPGLKLRLTPEEEARGWDNVECLEALLEGQTSESSSTSLQFDKVDYLQGEATGQESPFESAVELSDMRAKHEV